jgi:aspartyl-tRNA(Asn)/glutamyl-tRNA(Gln) amidotransferase subunit B
VLNERHLEIEQSPIDPERLAALVRLVANGAISGPVAKQVFVRMCDGDDAPDEIVRREGLGRIDDRAAIEAAVDSVLHMHPSAVAEYRAGRTKAFGFLVGQAMKATGGKANPELVNAALKKALG